jgi:hypothetical protein
MAEHAKFVSDGIGEGPDSVELEAVLASGLHDGLHEDEIEDMRRMGLAAPANSARPAQKTSTAIDWFAQNYPKLKPEDLAEFYRENFGATDTPIKTGTVDAFGSYRKLLAARVLNANVPLHAEPASEPQVLHIQADQADRHRSLMTSRRDHGLPRTWLIAVLTCFSLVAGGIIGMGLASDDGISGFISRAQAASQIDALLPALLRK